jgi:capsular polysaccharide biosynthesis protein
VGGRVIFLRRLLIVVLVTVIAGGLAYAFSERQQTRKVATASLVFGQPRPEMQIVASGFSSGDQSSQLVPSTNAGLVSADDVVQATASKLGMTAQQVRNDVKVSSRQNSQIVDIKASRPSAAQAAQLANTYANAYVRRAETDQRRRASQVRAALEKQLAALNKSTTTTNSLGNTSSAPADNLRSAIAAESALARTGSGSPSIASNASATDTSTSPQTKRNAIFGAVFGLVLGIGIASLAGGSRREPPYEDDRVDARNGDRRRSPVGV